MTNLSLSNASSLPAVLENLPYMVTTRDGINFDSREGVWPVDAKNNFDVAELRKRVESSLLEGLNGTLCVMAGKQSASSFNIISAVLRHYQRAIYPDGLIKGWTARDLRNYRVKLVSDFGHEEYLVKLRSFLKLWKVLRYPGVSEDVAKSLKEMSLKGVKTGRAVRTQDPEEGPLTQEELHNLTLDVYRAAEEGRIGIEGLSLVVFHIITGRRPTQSAALKCLDVDRSRRADPEPGQQNGEQLLLLHVPRAKQRGHAFRETRRSVHLIQVYFALFEAQKNLVQDEMRRALDKHGFHLQPLDLEHLLAQLPLYPHWAGIHETLVDAAKLLTQNHSHAMLTLRLQADGQFWHLTGSQIATRLQQVAKAAGTLSREGKPLTFGGTRLRYTKGTDLGRQGVGLAALAWLMDHSTLSSAGIYIDNLPEHAAEVSKAMAGSLVINRVASWFRGEVTDLEANAIGGDDPGHSRIHYKGEGAATCGIRKQCGMGDGIPLACYTCDRFQPWIDGPHETVLNDLEQERNLACKTLGADHPVTKRRDKTIAAVIIVIQRCDARKRELAAAYAAGSVGK